MARFKAWGQDPRRPSKLFATAEHARLWAEAEAPMSSGWAFVEDRRKGHRKLYTFRADTGQWADGKEPTENLHPVARIDVDEASGSR